MTHTPTVRQAGPTDVATILTLIRELAAYEELTQECVASAESLHQHLFGERQVAEVLLAEVGHEAVGFALFFTSFSTFLAKPCLYLEDLFVRPDQRKIGAGKALLKALAHLGVERDCGRIEWHVLDWNQLAIDFYDRQGARHMDDWYVYRLDRAGMEALLER
jgi:GNAT superfamily N-acetyltransferase